MDEKKKKNFPYSQSCNLSSFKIIVVEGKTTLAKNPKSFFFGLGRKLLKKKLNMTRIIQVMCVLKFFIFTLNPSKENKI